jgi:hypothetical protein
MQQEKHSSKERQQRDRVENQRTLHERNVFAKTEKFHGLVLRDSAG